MKRSSSYDYYLILATVAVLFVISMVCLYGMFAFKLAQVQQLPVAEKAAFMNQMNMLVAPFIIGLILILGICVPKRLLPTKWLNWFGAGMLLASLGVGVTLGVKNALLVVLTASLVLQLVVLVLALVGSSRVWFEKSGYWTRLGSSLVHLGLILFIFDLFFYRIISLHLVLFWVTTVSTVLGMLFSFYAETVTDWVKRLRATG